MASGSLRRALLTSSLSHEDHVTSYLTTSGSAASTARQKPSKKKSTPAVDAETAEKRVYYLTKQITRAVKKGVDFLRRRYKRKLGNDKADESDKIKLASKIENLEV